MSSTLLVRSTHIARVRALLSSSPVVAVLGARQVGKTTLARQVAESFAGPVTMLDLEDAAHAARLTDPQLALAPLEGLVVLDEVQHRPDLFPTLRVLADRPRATTRFLLLGSASLQLVRGSSESLAGRVAYHELGGFDLSEVGAPALHRLWLRGSFPRSFLAPGEPASAAWRRDFVRTFVERDLPLLGVTLPAVTLRRFWSMLAHYHAQVWNASEIARSFGVADTTVRRYLDLLTGAFMVRVLPPWRENLAKRQVKSPKIYLTDSGVLHTLLGAEGRDALEGHPKVGASWEGFALGEVITRLAARPEECFFWSTHAKAELDLLVIRGTRRLGFEFKRTAAPSITPSMRIAMTDLKLDHLDVVHAGTESFPLGERIRALALSRLLDDLAPLD